MKGGEATRCEERTGSSGGRAVAGGDGGWPRGHLFRDPSTSLEQNSWWPQPQDNAGAPWKGGKGVKESTSTHVRGEKGGGDGKERRKERGMRK